jgi:hypothetical protein
VEKVMSVINGDIIFKTPDQEMMRFTGDGQILVKGHPITSDKQVVEAFKRWLGKTGHLIESPISDLTFASGVGRDTAKGGDLILHNDANCVCPSLIHGHQADCQFG